MRRRAVGGAVSIGKVGRQAVHLAQGAQVGAAVDMVHTAEFEEDHIEAAAGEVAEGLLPVHSGGGYGVAGGPCEGLGGAVVIAGGEVDGNPAEVVPAAVDVVGVVH